MLHSSNKYWYDMKLLVFGLIVLFTLTPLTIQKKKDPRDYTDADIHKLDEQWTVSCCILLIFYFLNHYPFHMSSFYGI